MYLYSPSPSERLPSLIGRTPRKQMLVPVIVFLCAVSSVYICTFLRVYSVLRTSYISSWLVFR